MEGVVELFGTLKNLDFCYITYSPFFEEMTIFIN
jgi:hypothetical protein